MNNKFLITVLMLLAIAAIVIVDPLFNLLSQLRVHFVSHRNIKLPRILSRCIAFATKEWHVLSPLPIHSDWLSGGTRKTSTDKAEGRVRRRMTALLVDSALCEHLWTREAPLERTRDSSCDHTERRDNDIWLHVIPEKERDSTGTRPPSVRH
ncbi:hypothetical protein GEV33_002783 [Tenebrio molitor]|uniref:Uncharacterized protein n=1 Tax=Tenebrio molitor TaxID=7067 RepID=A0A8J6HUV0_TENMO|nr:hypothetical protein GEV33_002783 [Tenebrio molitor]